MDLSKAFSIGVEYKERKELFNWETRLFADVVFIDKTHHPSIPQLYQLKDNLLPEEIKENIWKSKETSFSRDSFILLGEVSFIDKKAKQITLTNKNIVAYQYLIIVSGTKTVNSYQDPEFSGGLCTLTEALRVKPKLPETFAPPSTNCQMLTHPHKSTSSNTVEEISQNPINKIAHPHMTSANPPHLVGELSSFNKRFYEIQT